MQQRIYYNNEISGIRGRIERIFGHFTQIFEMLKIPFREGIVQHGYVIHIASTIHNFQI